MCTVTYVPIADGFILTSNRDEKKTRSIAIRPTLCNSKNFKIVYPKDPDGKGSWIAFNTTGIAIVLLNGAFVKHESKPFYHKSRGLVLMEIISANNPKAELSNLVLEGIEPFTLIVCEKHFLTEFRWDGVLAHTINLDPKMANIWSSATLYDKFAGLKRAKWFENWQLQTLAPKEIDIMNFHHFTGESCFEGLVINREKVKTVSITCVAVRRKKISMTYKDLQNETIDVVTESLC
ncbi:NRDE family protein [Pedobacter aquatilis]|uniref:NRDE family protein n=1 Tax=Pedobacter aquatilis TaxID=351343 RepID=UPI0025B54B7D|nr:NRDE family protein [Pedobacter aquatilis]MDN3585970.1 NRDE family protein [Pedobacter aquatilis]